MKKGKRKERRQNRPNWRKVDGQWTKVGNT
jgi:hypothetical protein